MREGKVKFAVYFPGCRNEHLVKDIGTIPFALLRHGCEGTIITLNNEPYTRDAYAHMDGARKGLKMAFIGSPFLGLVRHFFGNRYDAFQVYHYTEHSMAAALVYRLFHPFGYLWLKLDTDRKDIAPGLIWPLFRLARFNLVTSEHAGTTIGSRQAVHMPNGVDVPDIRREKENIVLHIGHLGSPERQSAKAVEQFLDAIPYGWKLVLVGRETPGFTKYRQTITDHRVEYAGYMDHDQLLELCARSKIILMPSLWESYGYAVVEALCMGCVLVGPDIMSYREHTRNGTLGHLYTEGRDGMIASSLQAAMSSPHGEEQRRYARDTYDLKKITAQIWERMRNS